MFSTYSSRKRGFKILLVEPFGQSPGHPSAYAQRLTKALIQLSYSVVLVSYNGFRGDWDKELQVTSIRVSERIKGMRALAIDKITRFVPVGFLKTFITSILAFKICSRVQCDVIHFLDGSPFGLLIACMLMPKCHFVVNIPSIDPRLFERNNSPPLRARLKRRVFGLILTEFSALGICNSQLVIDAHSISVPSFRTRSVYIPWGIDSRMGEKEAATKWEARKRLGIPESRFVVLFFGTLRPDKGLEELIDSLRWIKSGVLLLIAGADTSGIGKSLFKKVNGLGRKRDVILHMRYIEDNEVGIYFTAADIVALPYRGHFVMASGVLSYACEYGVPVITSNTGQLGYFVERYGLGSTFQPGDARELASCILNFRSNSKEHVEAIKKNIARFAQTYSWEMIAKEHLKVYRKLLSS